MTARFASLQSYAVSFIGAVLFAAVMVSAAVPVVPVA